MTRPARNSENGFTIMEAVVASLIFSIIALAVTTFLVDSQRVNFSVEAQTDMSTLGQQGLDEMRWRLEQSRRILDVTSGYLPMLDLEGSAKPAGEVRLARIEPNGSLTPRAGEKDAPFVRESVGNALLFVEVLPPFREPKSGRLIDLYRFVLYYVAETPSPVVKMGHMPYYLELVCWESVVYADFQQVDSLAAEARQKEGQSELEGDVVRGLAAKGVAFAWDGGSPPEYAFSRLAGGTMVRPPEPHHNVKRAASRSAIAGMGHGQHISGFMSYSLAPNTGELPIKNIVPKFAQVADGFPNGFEVLIAGPGHGRKVMVRLVLVAQTHGRYFSREHLMLAAVWD